MKKLIMIIALGVGLLTANAQIQTLSGPRLGMVYITSSPGSAFLNGDFKLFDDDDPFEDYDQNETKGALTSLYGWQLETRFADGGNVTGIVEFIALIGGMEKGKFLPSFSSLVGVRTYSGFEFALGPNLSLSGIGMVFGMGYNFKSGNLNIPINIAFVPGKKGTHHVESHDEYNDVLMDPDGIPNNGDEYWDYQIVSSGFEGDVDYHSGSRFSITVGFNLGR